MPAGLVSSPQVSPTGRGMGGEPRGAGGARGRGGGRRVGGAARDSAAARVGRPGRPRSAGRGRRRGGRGAQRLGVGPLALLGKEVEDELRVELVQWQYLAPEQCRVRPLHLVEAGDDRTDRPGGQGADRGGGGGAVEGG